MQTHTFILPSGIEAEIRDMLGESSEVFTKKKNIETGMAHSLLIKEVLVRVGDNTNITIDFIENLLSKDRKVILFVARQYTYDFPKEYVMPVKFGKSVVEFPVTLEDFVPKNYPFYEEVLKARAKESEKGEIPEPIAIFKSYSEVLEKRKIELLLPKSKKKAFFYLMTGKDEKKALKVNMEEASLLTVLSLRNPTTMGQTGEVMLNLKELHAMDISELHSKMNEHEGNFDTSIEVSNPDKFGDAKMIQLLDSSFFFPSHHS